MGTRSVLAIIEGDGFKGRYCHWDGYPESMGARLWQSYREVENNADALIEYAVKPSQDGRWSSFVPPSEVAETEEKYGTHGTATWRDETDCGFIHSTGDDWGTEWAYVIGDLALTVFERRFGKPNGDLGHGTGMFGMGASDTEVGGYWALVGTYYWDESEPNWELVQNTLNADSIEVN